MKTIEEIEEYLRSQKVSGVMAVRFRKLARSFATVESFFAAKRSDIEKMYNRNSPGGKHGIGKKFWPVFDMALEYFNGKVGEVGNGKGSSAEPESEVRVAEASRKLVKMVTYKELKAIVDMMEYCGIEAINFLEIIGFLENVRFRQKAPEGTASAEAQDAGVLNAK